MKMVKELKGYSGCRLILDELNGVKVVKKISPDIRYNKRLLAQKEKQSNCFFTELCQCDVLEDGYENGLYYFTMQYINGDTLSGKMEQINLSLIDLTVQKLTYYYENYVEEDKEAFTIFRDKVKSIKDMVGNNDYIDLNEQPIKKAFSIIEKYSWGHIVSSPCHGDMTLENIVVSGEQLFLIDYLDSFYETWMIDAAKILQDVECYWSYRNIILSVNLRMRLLIFRDCLLRRIRSLDNGEDYIVEIYHILLMNLLRILPYSKSKKDYEYLKKTLSVINMKIEKGLI